MGFAQGSAAARRRAEAPVPAALLGLLPQDLLSTLHGNPHSSYGWAQHASEAAAERVRQLTLALCQADPQHYECVLTSGATGAVHSRQWLSSPGPAWPCLS